MCTLCIANWVMEFHSNVDVKWLEWMCDETEWKWCVNSIMGKSYRAYHFTLSNRRVLSKSFWLSGFLQFDARFHYDDESTLNVDFPQYSQYLRTEWFSSLNILTWFTHVFRNRNFNLLQCNEWHFIVCQLRSIFFN